MSKTIAILQSAYISWKRYCDLINLADEFIFDDAQFTKGNWRNRNVFKTAQGMQWLIILVAREKRTQRIRDTRVNDTRWARKHWSTISRSYAKAAYFEEYRETFEQLYREAGKLRFLSDTNFLFLDKINGILDISTTVRWSSQFQLVEGRTERLFDLCQQCGATRYLSGPAAKSHLDGDPARRESSEVDWMDYAGYPEYPQLHGVFQHEVTVRDLLFNTGIEAARFMKSFGTRIC